VTNTAQVVWSWVTRKLGDGYTFSVLIRSGRRIKSLRFMSPILGSGLISRRGASHEFATFCTAGERRPQLIRYSLSMADRLILVDHVPAEVCDRCGEVTLSPDVVNVCSKPFGNTSLRPDLSRRRSTSTHRPRWYGKSILVVRWLPSLDTFRTFSYRLTL